MKCDAIIRVNKILQVSKSMSNLILKRKGVLEDFLIDHKIIVVYLNKKFAFSLRKERLALVKLLQKSKKYTQHTDNQFGHCIDSNLLTS